MRLRSWLWSLLLSMRTKKEGGKGCTIMHGGQRFQNLLMLLLLVLLEMMEGE